MPVAVLLVEGSLDAQLLGAVLAGEPAIKQCGSKNSLSPRARTERRENRVNAAYLRDRDFDYDPPESDVSPIVDSEDGGTPLGWRWCRLETENYLLEPSVVAEATGCGQADFEEALVTAARSIRFYQAARWAIGTARRQLPPNYELRTRPDGLNEFELPEALDENSSRSWTHAHVAAYRDRIVPALNPENVIGVLQSHFLRFDLEFTASVPNVLLWFSGKDLLAALTQWLADKAEMHPGGFRARVRDWIRSNPERTLSHLPEWAALVRTLRG